MNRPELPNETDFPDYRPEWTIPKDVTYLNHGSFGPSPKLVQQAQQEWSERLEQQPMDFFMRKFEGHLEAASESLGRFVGCNGDDLIFVENATVGMNIVATSLDLQPDDEVLLSDQEYGAVLRIWRNVCQQRNAKVVVQKLPSPLISEDELVDALISGVTSKTKLIVVSHITSPTAVIFPVEKICRRARELKVPVCIDGPHAVAMIAVDLQKIGCDFYAASCHKWLSAPFGSGFLYVHRRSQQKIKPAVVSWGGSVSGRPSSWKDEFNWVGTRDPAAYLSVSVAIDFLKKVGLDTFRRQTHELARYARRQVVQFTGLEPLIPDSEDWYGSMIALPLPPSDAKKPKHGHRDPLQDELWEKFRIEIPIVEWKQQRFIRVSCHLYNRREEIDLLVEALQELLD